MTIRGAQRARMYSYAKNRRSRRRGTRRGTCVAQKGGHRRPDRHRYIGAHGGEAPRLDLRLVSRNLARGTCTLSDAAIALPLGVSTLRMTSALTCCSGLRSWPRRAVTLSPHRATGTR